MRVTSEPWTKTSLPRRSAGALLAREEPKVPRPEAAAESAAAGHKPLEAPPSLDAVDWEALEPRGFYARVGQRVLHYALLAATLPPALVLALPIALVNLALFRDPRRILYSQPRVGHRGRVFHIYKFRTMTEPRGHAFDSWSSGEDRARVTRFGRLLRNAHLDELPQIGNVLRGEMTFVGPRPEMVEIDAWARERIPGFHRRLALRPGITGRSQVTQGYAGLCTQAYARKLEGDLEYCRRFGLWEDLAILARTALWMLRGRGWRWQAGGAAEERTPEVEQQSA